MSSTLALYAIVDDLAEIEAQLEERGGELDDEIEARLDALEADLEGKCERIAGWRQNLVSSAKAYQDEADRLSKRAKTLTRTADSLKRYLHAQLERAGRTKLEAGTFRLSVQRNGLPTVTVTVEPALLPDRFRRVTIDADRRALAAAAERGEVLPDGVLIERSTHLRIR